MNCRLGAIWVLFLVEIYCSAFVLLNARQNCQQTLFVPAYNTRFQGTVPIRFLHRNKYLNAYICFITECATLTAPAAAAGSLSTNDRYEGITVSLTCNSGYALVGDSSTICNSGSWSTTLGTCQQGNSYCLPREHQL